ncbi:hypothetical protein Cme02nite_51690 [Catellatospora methionotrophica]|uniref:Uncharacterized protein n=1 Tax=Catellatospora methionotrophica TaxID=121620 RepID=A0A8J3LCZ3_9ACTN|nr:hypothetical protein Cme02nite_51690 [Catellatospora methionotrophica]
MGRLTRNPVDGPGGHSGNLDRTGIDPAITGEPPEEQAAPAPVEPDGTARHSRHERSAVHLRRASEVVPRADPARPRTVKRQ